MSTMGPVMPTQSLMPPVAAWVPPSCSSTTIACTPLRRSSRAYRLAVSASSAKLRPATPCWLTICGVPSRVMPMKPTLTPCTLWIAYGAISGLPVAVLKAFADRYWKPAPRYGVPSAQPSTGWQPPFWIRSSSAAPSSNSWLPTLA